MDDLKKISGIGTAVAKRLTDSGIVTYEKLAAEAPDQLLGIVAGMRGMSLERVAVWQQKATELAQAKAADTANGQHYAKFLVELLLDSQNGVRRTRVVAVSDGEKKASWAGWQPAKLAETVAALAQLNVADDGEDFFLQLTHWQLVGHGQSGRMQPAERPFSVRLQLGLLDRSEPRHCLTTLYAKRLGSGERERLGEFAALLNHDSSTLLEIPVPALAEGDYRLEAEVSLLAEAAEGKTAVLQGGLFQMI